MLSTKSIALIAKLTKTKEADIVAAIKAETEQEIAIPEGLQSFTDSEIDILKNNEYKSGKEKGVEMLVKDAKEKHALDFTGKTIDGLMDAYGKKIIADAKLQPDVKVAELETKVKALQTTVTDYEKKIADKDAEVSGVKIRSTLSKYIPSLGENAPSLDQDDIINMMRSKGYDFKMDGENIVTMKDGQIITDKLSNPLAAKDVVINFMKEKKFIVEEKTPGGRGAGSAGGAFKPGKLSELRKQYEAEGKSLLGQDFKRAVEAAAKDNPEFEMD